MNFIDITLQSTALTRKVRELAVSLDEINEKLSNSDTDIQTLHNLRRDKRHIENIIADINETIALSDEISAALLKYDNCYRSCAAAIKEIVGIELIH